MWRAKLVPWASTVVLHCRSRSAVASPRQLSQPVPPEFVSKLANAVVVNSLEEFRELDGGSASLPLIGTHDGTFHCDETLACAMIKMLPAFEEAVILRTRTPEALQACDVVVDVGGIYDPVSHRYDHHQRDFNGTMAELGYSTKLSSAGLVYRDFGKSVLARLVDHTSKTSDVELDVLQRQVYKRFIEHVDGLDNGVAPFSGERNYAISTTLSDRVAALNPSWNEPTDAADRNARFCVALQLAGCEFAASVVGYVTSWWPARALVAKALDKAAATHPSRKILELGHYCPWPSHLLQLELERSLAGDEKVLGAAQYIVFPDSMGQGWRIQAVPIEENSFTTRQPLPESWRGLRESRLSEVSGIPGCTFVHATGFIGGHTTREGALTMALRGITS